MRKLIVLVLLGASLIGGRALSGRPAEGAIETHEAMVHWINPAMLVISDTIEEGRSDGEEFDPVSLDHAAWAKLESAASSLEYSSRRMARAKKLRVGAHTAEVVGFASKSEIQGKLDGDPRRFRALSREMAGRAAALRTAAAQQDVRKILDRVDDLSESCQGCHTLYWEKPKPASGRQR